MVWNCDNHKKLPEEHCYLVWPGRRNVAIFGAPELLRRIIACICTRHASGCRVRRQKEEERRRVRDRRSAVTVRRLLS